MENKKLSKGRNDRGGEYGDDRKKYYIFNYKSFCFLFSYFLLCIVNGYEINGTD